MRTRFPLSVRILSWFFLNLALLALVAFIFAQQKMRFGLDSLVTGPAGDRLRAVSILVVEELNQAPREQWTEVLERFSREYGVRLLLFGQRGGQIAGTPSSLPPEVAARIRNAPGPERRPPRPRDDFEPGVPLMRPPVQGPLPRGPGIVGLQRAGKPPRYFALMHAPLPRLGPDGPALLVLESDSLAAGGLIFDLRPLLWAIAGVIALSVLFWLPLIRGITRSIASMRSATARIAEGRFDTAVDDSRRDELGALGASINSMSERLAGLVQGQRRFLSDVAHELCAPLSRLQVALGIMESRASSSDAEQLNDLREEVDQISTLVNELLSFSRASLGAKKIQLRPVNLREVLIRAVDREAAGTESVRLECDENLFVLADSDLLLRAVANVLRNALHHSDDAEPILLRAQRNGDQITIDLIDNGPGIPAAALPQIFDPFYRLDASRTRDTGGVGLGLTIAKTCVEACGGTITLENVEPRGLRVSISLRSAPTGSTR